MEGWERIRPAGRAGSAGLAGAAMGRLQGCGWTGRVHDER